MQFVNQLYREKCPGISFLKTIPTRFPEAIKFEPWINGHHAFLSKVKSDYFTARGGNTGVVDNWVSLSKHLLPISDSSEEYFRTHSVSMPLGNILFNQDATFSTDAQLNLASSLTTELSTLTGFSNNSHVVRSSMFDIELMEHISQNTQTIPWRGHRTVYKNWDFSKDIMLQRVIVKRGAAGIFFR